jgi:DNA-binding MarR family transcriptional regulator
MERGITPAAVSRHLEVLEEMGFIRRKDREDNKREHILVVTDSGANLVSNAEELLDLAMDEIMSDVSKTEAENMNKILEKLLTRFKDMI